MKNKDNLDTICGAIAYAIGIAPPKESAVPNATLCEYIDNCCHGKKVERIFMYNPDAIAQWIYHKYEGMFSKVKQHSDVELPLCTVMPSVTPVCFATMYTGAQPEIHGIRGYVKPVIKTDSIFDAFIRSGKRAAIVSTAGDSMSKIFLERDMDYYIYDTVDEVNEKARELILLGQYDLIAVYNGNYDTYMHKFGPESEQALHQLYENIRAFESFYELIIKHWKNKDSLVGFAMDHGCHEIDGGCGSHGLDMDEDLNIVHFYKIIKANKN